MSIKQAIASHLLNDPDIARRCGGRVYLTVAPQRAVLPYITLQQISAVHVRHMAAATGLVDGTFQINAFDASPTTVDDLANEIREALDHMLNTTIGTPPYTALVKAAMLQGHIDDFIPPTDASGVGIYGIRMTWTVWYTETIPTFA